MVIVQAVMVGSYQISSPFMPQFLISLGVHPLAQVEYWTGAILASSSIFSAVASPFWGNLSDRWGRKAMVLRSSIAVGITMGLTGLCQDVWQVVATRVLMGLFSGFSASAMALVATQVPEENLGSALGWLSTGQIAGTLIGPLVGGLLADQIRDYRAVFFYSAAGIMFIGVSLTLLVREGFERGELSTTRVSMWNQFNRVVRHPDLAPMFVVILLAQVTAIGLTPILPLYVASIVGNVSWLGTATGAVLAVTGLAGLMAAPFLGRAGDTSGYRPVLLTSLAGAALFTLPQAIVGNIGAFIGLRFGVGIFLGGILPSANAIIGRIARPEERGQIYGITSTAQFLGRSIGPLLGGIVAAHFGFSAVFFVFGGLMLANLVWVAANVRPATVS
ncbi:MAG TPA: MFS transporter [Candidatus Binatia bacterium]|nr:MFS transporter [Candidatus Binatia bacterium]